MKAALRTVDDHGNIYTALMFCCPGCADVHGNSGLHMLPVNSPNKSPQWGWDGNLEAPTLSPSILTRGGANHEQVCHSYLKAGVFEFLADCTHALANQHVPMSELPTWATDDDKEKPHV